MPTQIIFAYTTFNSIIAILSAWFSLVSELIPKLRFHYILLHWVSDYLPLSLNQERF